MRGGRAEEIPPRRQRNRRVTFRSASGQNLWHLGDTIERLGMGACRHTPPVRGIQMGASLVVVVILPHRLR